LGKNKLSHEKDRQEKNKICHRLTRKNIEEEDKICHGLTRNYTELHGKEKQKGIGQIIFQFAPCLRHPRWKTRVHFLLIASLINWKQERLKSHARRVLPNACD
jgi:hypothetical protein